MKPELREVLDRARDEASTWPEWRQEAYRRENGLPPETRKEKIARLQRAIRVFEERISDRRKMLSEMKWSDG